MSKQRYSPEFKEEAKGSVLPLLCAQSRQFRGVDPIMFNYQNKT